MLDGATATLNGFELDVKGSRGELKKIFKHPRIRISTDGNVVKIATQSNYRKDLAIVGTWVAHVKNMLKGITKGYETELKIVFMHFPMTAKVDGTNFMIINFLGEKGPRKAKIAGNTKIEIQKDTIKVSGTNKEDVGQTAANIEQLCHKGDRDIRVFQDGVYIVTKS